MSAADKLLARMHANPRADWTMREVRTICAAWGIDIRSPSGSHHTLKHPRAPRHLTIPARRPIKHIYIQKLVKMIDHAQGQ